MFNALDNADAAARRDAGRVDSASDLEERRLPQHAPARGEALYYTILYYTILYYDLLHYTYYDMI